MTISGRGAQWRVALLAVIGVLLASQALGTLASAGPGVVLASSVSMRQPANPIALGAQPWMARSRGAGTTQVPAQTAAEVVQQSVQRRGWTVISAQVAVLGTARSSVDVSMTRGRQRTQVAVQLSRRSPSAAWRLASVQPSIAPAAAFASATGWVDPPGVTGNQDLGAFIGNGALLLPGDFTGDTSLRRGAAECIDCSWRRRPACLDAATDTLCQGAAVSCPPGEIRYQVLLLRPPATSYVVIGTVCRGPDEQLRSPDDVGRLLTGVFVDYLPRARPTYQPANGALVNLPAIFSSGEPGRIGPLNRQIVGYRVAVVATAQWRWAFGDGGRLITTRAGGPYPDMSVAHTYATSGAQRVRLSSSWAGTFTVDGLGPFAVGGGPVVLRSQLPVQVRPAGAVLISPA